MSEPTQDRAGAFADHTLRQLINSGAVTSTAGFRPDQIQPASLDLSLSDEGYRVPGSLLPLRGETIRDILGLFRVRPLDLSKPAILDRGQVYLIRLNESLNLPPDMAAYTNNKSSIGRIDLQTRTLSDRNPRFDKHRAGYRGELWLEISPKSFDVEVVAGISLNQAIFYRRRFVLDDTHLRTLMSDKPLMFHKNGAAIAVQEIDLDQGVLMSVDLEQEVCGFVARKSPEPLILHGGHRHAAADFFDVILRPRRRTLHLLRGNFYILSTLEYLRVPPNLAVEMLPYETTAGEFRAHYAGFFDPGFGFGATGEVLGTPAVLEVRPYDDDLILRHAQPICKMAYETLNEVPERPYGVGTQSHYHDQRGPKLSKYFEADTSFRSNA